MPDLIAEPVVKRVPSIYGMDFRPPTLSLPFVRFGWRILPFCLRKFGRIVSIELSEEDRQRILQWQDRRILFTPNHPTIYDPVIMLGLSRILQAPFNYLAAREIFDLCAGLNGKILQKMGAFSVVRGVPDRESFRTTRSVLSSPGARLVIFPEGEVYTQNDSLLPFHSGTLQIAFWALDDLAKGGEQNPTLLIVPTAIRYLFVEDMRTEIADSLRRLEEALCVPANPEGDTYERLRAVGLRVLEVMEIEYGIKPESPDNPDLTPRMEHVKLVILGRAAGLLGVTIDAGQPIVDQMRQLMNAAFAVTREEPGPEPCDYQVRLHIELAERTEPLFNDLRRVTNWIVAQDNHVRARPTYERMAEIVVRLEREVFGKEKLSGKRKAVIKIGESIDLGEHYEAYKKNRKSVVAELTHQLESAVRSLLDSTEEAG